MICILSSIILYTCIFYTALDLKKLTVICTFNKCKNGIFEVVYKFSLLVNNQYTGTYRVKQPSLCQELYLQDMAPKKQKGSSAEQELSDSVPTIQKSQKHNPKLKIF